ncbi:helix-turn-helix domain-containing protein [Microtetraspora malaysiensis]|uniref:helix-turn-helix domain-containing protein n=1 Tax=Microtetraspora malaysiensis TaxID=161358 RepID=UPI00083207F2|nr:helix-turn-helix domain-containing protein [Microtetraspora malaysiensis]
MAQQYYSVDQVAELLDLHVRTVRGYVRDGRLKATRIGKQYRITREDLEAFTGGSAPSPSSSPSPAEPRAEVSGIVQIDGIDRDAASRLANALIATVNSPRTDVRLHVQTVYDEQRAALKVVILGGLEDAAELLKIIEALIGPSK